VRIIIDAGKGGLVSVRFLLGWACALASLAVGIYAAVWQERASLWSWGGCVLLLWIAVALLRRRASRWRG
jgi:hypothetical protein